MRLAREVSPDDAAGLAAILVEHKKKCADCISFPDCDILALSREYGLVIKEPGRKKRSKMHKLSCAVEFDEEQCVGCGECSAACKRQSVDCLERHESGYPTYAPKDEDACVYCGQCTLSCPAASAQEQSFCGELENILKETAAGKVISVIQFAPSLRVSFGEFFSGQPGENCEDKLYSALESLGFSYVSDVNFGADLTTLHESSELIERLRGGEKSPLLTSCCPAWVAYVKKYQPELLPSLAKSLSPHLFSALALKSFWADSSGNAPEKIRVISVVPCTAKKHEASLAEHFYQGRPLVDLVLTARELAYILKKRHIDFNSLPPAASKKQLFNNGSGAAAIYASSGGVMESALRSAAYFLKDEKAASDSDSFASLRFNEGLAEKTVSIAGKEIRLGIISGLASFEKVSSRLGDFDYLEVMACPGGCVNGGGQKLYPDESIIKARRRALYEIDKDRPVRRAHENDLASEVYGYLKNKKLC